jgi:hypothetical protein
VLPALVLMVFEEQVEFNFPVCFSNSFTDATFKFSSAVTMNQKYHIISVFLNKITQTLNAV